MGLMLYALIWHVNEAEPLCRSRLRSAMHQLNFIALIHSASAQRVDVNEWMKGAGARDVA